MRVAVIGSRTCTNGKYIFTVLDEISNNETKITQIISGGARGADSFGKAWADARGVPTKIFYPNWELHGKKAGFVRNEYIIENSDLVIAFWDGKSKGTKHSIDIAKSKNIPYIVLHI